jgi:hypothetical protein
MWSRNSRPCGPELLRSTQKLPGEFPAWLTAKEEKRFPDATERNHVASPHPLCRKSRGFLENRQEGNKVYDIACDVGTHTCRGYKAYHWVQPKHHSGDLGCLPHILLIIHEILRVSRILRGRDTSAPFFTHSMPASAITDQKWYSVTTREHEACWS